MSSDPGAGEVHALLASARALVEELVEEGVDRFERVPLASAPQPPGVEPPNPPPEPAPLASAPQPPGVEPPGRPPETAPAPLAPPPGAARDQLGLLGAALGETPTLEAVRDALGDCTRCRLCEGRSQIVFGVGNPRADILFVGEGPGAEEDRQGVPFVGRAGELLTAMIEKGLGIERGEVYICNIVKCRPPGNRTPLADEVSTCRPFLDGQIAAVRPRVIVALGKPATSLLLGRDVAITRLRGTWHDYQGIPLMPTLHPAFVLRQYTPENRRAVWSDLKAALARSREAEAS